MIRYPGGKNKLKKKIHDKLLELKKPAHQIYCEPFVGAGSIVLSFLDKNWSGEVWINDLDVNLINMWKSVKYNSQELKKRVLHFTPSVDKFYSFKEDLLNDKFEDEIDSGFKKLVIHQISYSGLGEMSGGPLGGKFQKSKYKIDCRWSPKNICKKIDEYSSKLKKSKIYNKDYKELLFDDSNILYYLDPPYYKKGGELYKYSFDDTLHDEMSKEIKNFKSDSWLISYDNCSEIRKLYFWAKIEDYSINYSINTTREGKEVFICAR